MSSSEKEENHIDIIQQLADKHHYKRSLMAHMLEYMPKSELDSLLKDLSKPYNSLWVQVNTSRIDIDSLINIFEDSKIFATKNKFFSDILEVKIEKGEIFDKPPDDLPFLYVDREQAQDVMMGKNVLSSGVLQPKTDDPEKFFTTGQQIAVVDHVGNFLAYAKALVNSNELANLPLQEVAKIEKSVAYIPPITELQHYRRGYFSILTPVEVVAVNSMYLDDLTSLENILVFTTGRGEVASYIAEKTKNKFPVTIVARNKMQSTVIQKQIQRVGNEAVRIVTASPKVFINDTHRMKYTLVYLELPNSKTGLKPVTTSNLDQHRLKSFVKYQHSVITDLYKCLHPNALINYVTHSIDWMENEELFEEITNYSYYEEQGFPRRIRELKKKGYFLSRIERNKERMDTRKIIRHTASSLFIDPREMSNIGGYIAKFKFSPTKVQKKK